MNVRLVWMYCKVQLLEVIRSPAFILPVFIWPVVFFLYFGQPSADDQVHANQIMVSYILYAMLTAALFQFSGGVAENRRRSWQTYLRTLPHVEWMLFSGQLVSGLLMAIAALLPVLVLALATTPVSMQAGDWALLAIAALIGSIPVMLLAVALGHWLHPKSALPLGHLVFISLAYAGSLWTLPQDLPAWLREVSTFTPTRMWAEVAWSASLDQSWLTWNWLGILLYSVLLAIPAGLGIVRYEEERY